MIGYTTDASNEDLQKQMPTGRTYITDASDEDLQKLMPIGRTYKNRCLR